MYRPTYNPYNLPPTKKFARGQHSLFQKQIKHNLMPKALKTALTGEPLLNAWKALYSNADYATEQEVWMDDGRVSALVPKEVIVRSNGLGKLAGRAKDLIDNSSVRVLLDREALQKLKLAKRSGLETIGFPCPENNGNGGLPVYVSVDLVINPLRVLGTVEPIGVYTSDQNDPIYLFNTEKDAVGIAPQIGTDDRKLFRANFKDVMKLGFPPV